MPPVDESETFTKQQLEAIVEERNKALEAKRSELMAETRAAKDEARAIKAQLADMEQLIKAQKAGVSSEELQRMRAEVKADMDRQYKPYVELAETLKVENREMKLDAVVKQEMAKSGVRAERIAALFKVTKGDYDLTEDGKPMLRERPGTPLEKFIAEELKTQYPEFFEGTGSSGGGASKSIASGVGVRVISAGDPVAFGKYAADIASGKAEVR